MISVKTPIKSNRSSYSPVVVSTARAHKLKQQLTAQEHELLLKVKQETGIEPQIWAARSIATVFDKLGLEYDRTEKSSAPSFTKNFLQEHSHPIVQMIAKAREINKAHTTFIDTIIRYEHKGRIHAEINQIRSGQGGTVTGRFSYNNPNLQQLPARNKDQTGIEPQIWAARSIATVFDKLGLEYDRTEKSSAPSVS